MKRRNMTIGILVVSLMMATSACGRDTENKEKPNEVMEEVQPTEEQTESESDSEDNADSDDDNAISGAYETKLGRYIISFDYDEKLRGMGPGMDQGLYMMSYTTVDNNQIIVMMSEGMGSGKHAANKYEEVAYDVTEVSCGDASGFKYSFKEDLDEMFNRHSTMYELYCDDDEFTIIMTSGIGGKMPDLKNLRISKEP